MKKLNSLILTTFVLFGSGFVGKSMPAFSAEPQMNIGSKSAVKADGEAEVLAKLDLTDDQKNKFKSISIDSYMKIVPILTPEQRKKLNAGIKSRQSLAATLKSLNLTPAQNIKINPIIADYKKQILAILTPEQKMKIEALAPNK